MNTSPTVLLDMIQKEEARRLADDSLYEFVKQSWAVVEPGVKFVDSWHIQTICEHLEAVSSGEIRRLLVNIPPRHALRVGTRIPTLRGLVSVEDLAVDDEVFGPDGEPIKVTGKSDIFPDRQLYRVWTDDGAFIDVDGEHLWTVRLDRKYKQYIEYTTEQLWHRQNGAFLRKKRGGGTELNFERVCSEVRLPRLPDVSAMQYPEKDLLVDPYVLGVWLGDGNSTNSGITMTPEDFAHVGAEIERRGYKVRSLQTKYRHIIVKLQVALRKIGVLGNKHIPEDYFQASETQRRDLLRGLMDTDGSVSKGGQCFFAQSNRSFIEQVLRLLRGLGIKASLIESDAVLNGVSYGKTWKVSFYANDVAVLPRKELRTKKTIKRFGRYIRIEKLPERGSTQCIAVDRKDGLFLAGDGCIVTHNSKSLIVSVIWPMWEWNTAPSEKFLCASYSGTLSTRDNLKARRLIQSPWYQDRWGNVYQLTGDQNQKQRFENDKTGYRIATSVGGTATGEGGSRLILDDPHSAQEAQSDVIRESAIDWFDSVWSTRLNDPKRDAMVTIMQRLHERDISGHIIDDIKGWEHLMIPAEWDGVKRRTVLGMYDPRKKKDELICPERFGPAEITSLKQMLGTYGSSGQLQQDPTPSGGGILKTAFLQLWPHDKGLPQFEYILQSYDCAFTEKTTGDPTACSVWAVFTHKGARNAMLIDAWDDHLSYPDMRTKVVKDWAAEYGGMDEKNPFNRPRRPDRILVEEKASGQSLLQDLRLARVPAVGYNPGRADKVSRAHQAAPILELGLIWVPESGKNPGQPVSWAAAFIKQLAKFPVGEHDDYVDTFTQAVIYLRNDGFLALPKVKDPESTKRPVKEKVNPYAA